MSTINPIEIKSSKNAIANSACLNPEPSGASPMSITISDVRAEAGCRSDVGRIAALPSTNCTASVSPMARAMRE